MRADQKGQQVGQANEEEDGRVEQGIVTHGFDILQEGCLVDFLKSRRFLFLVAKGFSNLYTRNSFLDLVVKL